MLNLFKSKNTAKEKIKSFLRAIDPTLEECESYLRGTCPSCIDSTGSPYNLIVSFEDDVAMCYNCARWSSVESFKDALPKALRFKQIIKERK